MVTQGVYVLILRLTNDVVIDVASLGRLSISKGVYGYIGSAKGFGGIEARVKHHMARPKKRIWWHIDYLTSRSDVDILCVIYAKTLDVYEEDLVSNLSIDSCWSIAVARFGSTDKRSKSHLFRCLCDYDTCVNNVKTVFIKLGLEPKMMSISKIYG